MISFLPGSDKAPYAPHTAKGFLAVETDDVERIAKCITTYIWSPSAFAHGYRKKENFVKANWVGLDFDDGIMSLDDAISGMQGMYAIIGTTRSHQKEKAGKPPCDRFRILIRCERMMSLEENLETLRVLARAWPIDKACVDVARLFYPCSALVYKSTGKLHRVFTPKPESPQDKARRETRQQMARQSFALRGELPVWINKFVKYGKLTHSNSRNCTVYAAACELTRLGMPESRIFEILLNAPISGAGIKPGELENAIKNAIKKGVENGPAR